MLWKLQEQALAAAEQIPTRAADNHSTLVTRLGAVRAALIELGREVDAIAAEVTTTVDGARG